MEYLKKTNIITTLLFLLIFFAGTTAKGDRIRIYGQVVDEHNNPIELAMVRAEGQTGVAICNLKGKYSLYCDKRDSISLVYTMIGFNKKKHILNNPSGDSIQVNIQLGSIGRELDEATVKAYKRQTDAVQKLNVKQTKHMPSTTGNAIEELVATQMGVSTHNELSSQYNVRGGSFDENVVYLNGQEVYRPMLIRSGQQEGLSIINSNMVEDINFSAGGFPAKYGDKMSSVLDITYKKPKKKEAAISMSLLGADGYVGFGNKKFSMMNGIRYKTMRHLLGSMDTQGEYRPNFFDYQNYTYWHPNDKWTIDLVAYISSNHYNFVPEDRETKFGTVNDAMNFKVYFDGQEKDLFNTGYGALNLTHHFDSKTDLTFMTSVFKTKEQETYDIQGEYWLDDATSQTQLGTGTYMEHARNFLNAKVWNVGLRFQKKTNNHYIQTALNFKKENVRENATEWEMRDSSRYSIPHSDKTLKLIYNLRAKTEITSNRLEYYLQDNYRFHNGIGLFNVNYGMRTTYWDWNKEWLVSPRFSISLVPKFNENFTFRMATGIYYQAPFYKELRDTITTAEKTSVVLNKDIKSQKSIHILLGGDYQFKMLGRPFKFSTEMYYKILKDLIPYNINNLRVVYYGDNISKGYAAGIDFKLYGEFVPEADSWVTLSLMSTKEEILGKNIPRPTDQRYNLSVYFTDFFPNTTKWRLTLKGALAGGLPFGVPHGTMDRRQFRAPAYKRVDIGMSYRLLDNEDHHLRTGIGRQLRNVWLGLDAFNVLGINNVNSYYWITEITGNRMAIPNYLTGRLFNVKLQLEL